jgi:type II secretion system protein I
MAILISQHLKNLSPSKKSRGFTLIEVTVALTVLAIALAGIIVSSSELIRNIEHLRNKTISIWVASNIINEARVGLIKAPLVAKPIYGTTEVMNNEWDWQLTFVQINDQQYQVTVNVGKDKHYDMTTLVSFVRSS